MKIRNISIKKSRRNISITCKTCCVTCSLQGVKYSGKGSPFHACLKLIAKFKASQYYVMSFLARFDTS